MVPRARAAWWPPWRRSGSRAPAPPVLEALRQDGTAIAAAAVLSAPAALPAAPRLVERGPGGRGPRGAGRLPRPRPDVAEHRSGQLVVRRTRPAADGAAEPDGRATDGRGRSSRRRWPWSASGARGTAAAWWCSRRPPWRWWCSQRSWGRGARSRRGARCTALVPGAAAIRAVPAARSPGARGLGGGPGARDRRRAPARPGVAAVLGALCLVEQGVSFAHFAPAVERARVDRWRPGSPPGAPPSSTPRRRRASRPGGADRRALGHRCRRRAHAERVLRQRAAGLGARRLLRAGPRGPDAAGRGGGGLGAAMGLAGAGVPDPIGAPSPTVAAAAPSVNFRRKARRNRAPSLTIRL